MSIEVPGGVGVTAIGVAHLRARETRGPDRLFDDPYAEAFVRAAAGSLPQSPVSTPEGDAVANTFGLHSVIRTRFFDEYFAESCAGGICQVVLLAAGLDTRAFRLDWPQDVRLFELDLPEVLAFKEYVLSGENAVPHCDRTAVPVDLREDWPAALTGAGFRPGEPTAWLAEGLLIYLTAEEADRLLTSATELAAPGSRLSFEHGGAGDMVDKARSMPTFDRLTAMWKGGLGQHSPEWLETHGWRTQLHDGDALISAYGRAAPPKTATNFLTATRVASH